MTFVPDAAARAATVASVQPLLALWPVGTAELGRNRRSIFESAATHSRGLRNVADRCESFAERSALWCLYSRRQRCDDSVCESLLVDLRAASRTSGERAGAARFFATLLNTARFGYSRADFFFNSIVSGSVPGWVANAPIGAIVISGSTASNGASQITLAGANTGSNNATARNLFTVDDHIY